MVLRITGVVLAVEGWRHPFSAWLQQSSTVFPVHRIMSYSLVTTVINNNNHKLACVSTIITLILYIFLQSNNAVTSETRRWQLKVRIYIENVKSRLETC